MAGRKIASVDGADNAVSPDAAVVKEVLASVGVDDGLRVTQAGDVEDKAKTQEIISNITNSISQVTNKNIAADARTLYENIAGDERIPCVSLTRGEFVYYCAKSGATYNWMSIGAIQNLPYDDLYQMYSKHKRFLTLPNIVVADERVVRLLGLSDVYKNVADINNVKPALNNPSAMQVLCEKAKRVNMRDVLIQRLTQLRTQGVLTNIDVIRTAGECLNCQIGEA